MIYCLMKIHRQFAVTFLNGLILNADKWTLSTSFGRQIKTMLTNILHNIGIIKLKNLRDKQKVSLCCYVSIPIFSLSDNNI